MRITSLFDCSIATRHVAIEEVLMDSRNGTHNMKCHMKYRWLIMVDLDRTFQKHFKNEMDIIFGTISSNFSPKRHTGNHRFRYCVCCYS